MSAQNRNAPCFCGSGKRFKHCHGASAGARGAPPPPPLMNLAPALALERQLLLAGLELQGRNQPDAARKRYECVLALDASHPDALHLLALLDLAGGHLDSALAHAEQAVAAYPRHAAFHVTRARVLLALGRDGAAAVALRHAAGSSVERPEAWAIVDHQLAATAAPPAGAGALAVGGSTGPGAEGRAGPDDGEPDVAAPPEQAPALAARAQAAVTQGNHADAERLLREALAIAPERYETLVALGQLLQKMLRPDEAVAVYRQAIALAPGRSESTSAELARALVERGEIDAAQRLCAEALLRWPRSLRLALPAQLALKPVYASRSEIAATRARYGAGLAGLRAISSRFLDHGTDEIWDALKWTNFYLAYQGENDCALQSEYADFVGQLLDRALPALRQPLPIPAVSGRRIRIGFASAYFYQCTVGAYFRSWITDLDRNRFEIHIYHFRRGLDALGTELMAHADHFRTLEGDSAAGATIRADALDILVYPELGCEGATFLLGALRLAPVQCAGWGQPVTTGHANIDYFFSSGAMEPDDAQSHYRERLVRLPGLGTRYALPAPAEFAPVAQARERFGLPGDRNLYLFPQSTFKIHPDNDALLATVLRADPRGTLVLFAGHTTDATEQFLQRLGAVLAAHGLDIRARACLLPLLPRETYLRINAACDVMLDSLHWSGGNTSLDALACRLPVVTLPGAYMRGRQTAGMLRLLGVPELIAGDAEDYVRIALRVVQDRGWREQVRDRIAAGHPRLFDDPAPVAAMQGFYRSLFEGSAKK